jgi:hypothetical protein
MGARCARSYGFSRDAAILRRRRGLRCLYTIIETCKMNGLDPRYACRPPSRGLKRRLQLCGRLVFGRLILRDKQVGIRNRHRKPTHAFALVSPRAPLALASYGKLDF